MGDSENITEYRDRHYVEFTDIDCKYCHILDKILGELPIQIDRKEWYSKYNNYVKYDYEPFCTDGFYVKIICSSTSEQVLDFASYLYKKKLAEIKQMEKCLDTTTLY